MRALKVSLRGTTSLTSLHRLRRASGSGTVPVIPQPGSRIAEISTMSGARAAVVPQSYNDYVAADAADTNTHPHMGPFTHTAVKSGNWSDPSLWDTGTIPGANAVVNLSTFTVTYDLESDVLIKDIHVSSTGTMRWDITKDTRLWVDTIMNHGTHWLGDIANPVPESTTLGKPRVEIVFWQSEAPLGTTRLGLNVMGPVRQQGATKAERLRSMVDIPSGATSVTLENGALSNWRVGDVIVIAATENAGTSTTDAQYTGPTSFYGPMQGSMGIRTGNKFRKSQDEQRTITAISGNTVSWSTPLLYNHLAYTRTLPWGQTLSFYPVVASLSRSIRFRSADSSDTVWVGDLTNRQKRAHTMFMFSDDVQNRYAEAKNMGRTDTDPTLVAPTFQPGGIVTEAVIRATNGGTILTDPNNVRGRYPWHIHGSGAYFSRKQVVFEGLTAWAPSTAPPIPGWAITHHNSRAAIERCNVYNVRGAGIVSEKGNEIGQWIGNTVMWARGDGYGIEWGTRHEIYENHNGHSGVGYENQARQILQTDNIATSCNEAWLFFQQDTNKLVRIPDEHSLRLRDPIAQGGRKDILNNEFASDNDTYGIEQAQIPDFDRNVCYGCESWFAVSHRQYTDRYDSTPMISRGCAAINVDSYGLRLLNYSFYYSLYDLFFLGTSTSNGSMAFSGGPVSWQFVFANCVFERFNFGLKDGGLGLNYNGEYCDITMTNVAVPYQEQVMAFGPTGIPDDDPTHHPAYGVYPWTITDPNNPNPGYTAIVRSWAPKTKAQYPTPYPALPYGLGGVEPLPGTPKPYFWLDPSSDTTVVAGNVQEQINIFGAIVDDMGVRRYPDWQSSESLLTLVAVNTGRTGYYTTGEELIRRNGCFNDAGTWKSRLWFVDHNRMNGDYFTFYVDVTLTGFASDYLAANTVNPNATQPIVPLKPELLQTTAAIAADTTIPLIVSPAIAPATNGQKLAFRLQANKGQGKWAIVGGADAAKLELSAYTLRFAGDAIKSASSPDDANGDKTYEVQVQFTDQWGNQSAVQSITVPLDYFTDTFDGNLNDPLDNRTGWFYMSGQATGMKLDGVGNLVRPTGADSFVKSYDLPSYNQAVEAVWAGGTGWSRLALRFQDANNYVGLRRSDSGNVLMVYSRKAGVDTTVATYTQADTTAVYRMEVSGTAVTIKKNGVVQTPLTGGTTIADPSPNSYQVGIVGRSGGASGAFLSSIKFLDLP